MCRHFAEHEIDMASLFLLTNQDLIDIGVSALGARKKILRTIAEFPRDSFSVLIGGQEVLTGRLC